MVTDVCVIGAGFAGLTAARRLVQGGREVVVLEARDRVGGRVWTEPSAGGVPLDLGGTFIGPMHDRLHALVKEMGGELHRTYATGDSVLGVSIGAATIRARPRSGNVPCGDQPAFNRRARTATPA